MTGPSVAVPDGQRDRTIYLFASTAWDGQRLYDQRIARELGARGHEVTYVEPAVPVLLRREWHNAPGPEPRRSVAPGVWVVTPRMLPLGRRPLLAPLTAFLNLLQLRRLGGFPSRDSRLLVLAAHPVVLQFLPGRSTVVVVKDDYAAAGDLIGQSRRSVLRRRRALLRRAPCTTVVSPHLRDVLLREGVRAEVVPAGCNPVPADTQELAALAGRARPRALFSGMLSDRIDFEFLESVVGVGVELVLAGRRQLGFTRQEEYERLMASGHVTDLGELSEDGVAEAMIGCDVGLIPYVISDFNLASFPLKTFEYLGAGLPVVSTALPAVLWLDEEEITVVARPDQAGEAVVAAAERGQRPGTVEACRDVGRRNTWRVRAERYEQLFNAQELDIS